MYNKVLQHVYDCSDQNELLRYMVIGHTAECGTADFDLYHLSWHAIRNVLFDNFVNCCI